MSYAVHRVASTGVQSSPPEQPTTTALVLSYRCLFTHDLKQKRKRWQDGKLKYHTFNKRIMVYDDRNHFIGDAHWHEDGDLGEDDELTLDRGGAIVQVADCEGSREQDITEIVDKRAREVAKRRELANQTPRPRQEPRSSHRPLSSIVPSPGPIGRATVPNRSPFDIRKDGETERPKATPAKRRRTEESPPSKSSHAAGLFGARLNLSASTVPLSTLRARALRERSNGQIRSVQDTPGVNTQTQMQTQTPDLQVGEERPRRKEALPVVNAIPQGTVVAESSPPKRVALESAEVPSRAEKVVAMMSEAKDTPVDNTMQIAAVQQFTQATPEESRTDSEPENLEPPEPVRPGKYNFKAASPPITVPHSATPSPRPAAGDFNPIKESQKKNARPTSVRDEGDAKPESPARNVTITSKSPSPVRSKPDESLPRTELRIRSRKRRGLLMMSEPKTAPNVDPKPKQAMAMKPNKTTKPDPQPTFRNTAAIHKPAALENELEDAIVATPEPSPSPVVKSPESSDDSEPAPMRKRGTARDSTCTDDSDKAKKPKNGRRKDEEASESEDVATARRKPRTRKRRSPTPTESESDGESDGEDAPQGPRITKLARKGIKSREIIGFLPEMLQVAAPAPFAMAGHGVGTVGRPPTGPIRPEKGVKLSIDKSVAQRLDPQQEGKTSPEKDDAKPPPEEHPDAGAVSARDKPNLPEPAPRATGTAVMLISGESESDLAIDPGKGANDDTNTGAKGRIVNPASRGRKAALKQDAAGQTVQHTVPFDAPQPTTRRAVKPAEPKQSEQSLPGFSKASSGAWSKHAEDLLGMTRPTGKP